MDFCKACGRICFLILGRKGGTFQWHIFTHLRVSTPIFWKKEKTNINRKNFLSLFLSVVVLLGCFPITASSKEAQTILDTENSVLGNEGLSTYNEYSTQTQEFVSDEIIGNVEEIVSLREESVKHFRL